ncbi:MAG: HAD-IA family hydrolase [Candidatus Nanopelagicales bacterium]
MTDDVCEGLLLDIGVVLFKSAWEIADDYERLRGLPAGTVQGRGPLDPGGDPLWERYQAAEITERDYWLSFAARAVERGAPLDGHPHLMRAMFQTPGVDPVRPEAAALIREAAASGIRLGILTNEMIDFQGREFTEGQWWYPLFPVFVDSSELGIRKPDPQPYRVAIERMGLPADRIVFVDDNPAYVDAGRREGLRCVLLDVRDPAAAFDQARRSLGLG